MKEYKLYKWKLDYDYNIILYSSFSFVVQYNSIFPSTTVFKQHTSNRLFYSREWQQCLLSCLWNLLKEAESKVETADYQKAAAAGSSTTDS